MKLGKKKNADAPIDEKPVQKATKVEKKAAAGPKQKGLGSVAVSQSMVVILAGILAAVLIQFLVVQPSVDKQFKAQKVVEVDSAALRLNHHLEQLQKSVNSLAVRPDVIAAVSGGGDLSSTKNALAAALPGIKGVHLFAYRNIPRTTQGATLLGFAGLELARKAETGRTLHPDAFPKDGTWFVQLATPIRNPVSSAVVGSLLVVFDAAQLNPLLQVVNQQLGGNLALIQTVSGTSRTIAGTGSASNTSEIRTLSNPDWSLAYTPSGVPAAPIDMIMIALVIGIPVLVAAILVWLLLNSAQRSLRNDVTTLIQWAHKVFSGERLKLPTLQWGLAASSGEVLYRLSQVVDKRIGRAAGTAKSKSSKSSPARTAAPDADEPLFQDKDMPNIDMLDGDEDVLGFGGGADDPFGASDLLDVEESILPQTELSADIFRAYDIRGIVGETLSPEIVQIIGMAIGSEASERGVNTLCIGYDGRHSSPELADALARGIMATGCDVVHIGAVPTPVLYFATHELETGSGVMVTGSHNPANYNGLKIMLAGDTLSGEAIQKLYQRAQAGNFTSGQGSQRSEDVRRAYLDRIVGDIAVAAPLKVVVDAGNGIAGELGPMLIEELGCEVVPLYCEVDGDFPNHHPDPGKPANLADLIAKVEEVGADLGLAFDGDGDRLGVVANTGKIIWPDRLLMLFARDVVSRNPGADVLYDVKCSRRLAGVISEAGGRPIMWKSGHSLMKAKMKETGALLAGEMSGHVFFSERWYGFDDGLYSAARLLEILGIEDRHSSEVFEDFPEDFSTPELNIEVTESTKFAIVERLGQTGQFGDGNVSMIDGIRVDYADGWGLCRASNTTPVLVLRFEAETEEVLERIKTLFREQLKQVAPDITIDF